MENRVDFFIGDTVRVTFLIGSIVVAVAAWACGGSSSSSSAPTPTSATTMINIQLSNGLGNLGANSYSPNPASVTQGGPIAWHNSDSTTHHIVLDDGSLDTGDIAPGASSAAKQLMASSAQYHCTIHPSMVGSINAATNPSPPPGPGY
jgi:plastocyanin